MRSTDSHLDEHEKARTFEALLLPHLDAAYNLARWLTRNDQNAEDLVQMAYLRAFKFFDSFHGVDARAWLLTILRNAYFTSLRDNRHENADTSFDEDIPIEATQQAELSSYGVGNSPENVLASKDTARVVNQALENLPPAFREVIVLKEIDDLSYKEIAEIAGIPIGTVMSRLARGRKLLSDLLKHHALGG
jgi:RNA polymerase sigma-70 factor (ECF subfamily)